jgi:hypothetical protein
VDRLLQGDRRHRSRGVRLRVSKASAADDGHESTKVAKDLICVNQRSNRWLIGFDI